VVVLSKEDRDEFLKYNRIANALLTGAPVTSDL
jgi:hypothetical protein